MIQARPCPQRNLLPQHATAEFSLVVKVYHDATWLKPSVDFWVLRGAIKLVYSYLPKVCFPNDVLVITN